MTRATRVAAGLLWLVAGATAALAASPREAGNQALAEYLKIQTALAGDSVAGVREAAGAVTKALQACDCSAEQRKAADAAMAAARALDGADLPALREQFKGLSRTVTEFLSAVGVDSAQLYYCPMAEAYWLQPEEDAAVHNPYYGAAMLRCGVKKAKIEEAAD